MDRGAESVPRRTAGTTDWAKALARRRQAGQPDQEGSHGRLLARAVRCAQEGDHEALAFLYARYADRVFGHVLAIVRDHHAAEDVTQHVFAKLIAVIGSYEERDVPFLAWLLRVARNIAVDHLRGQRLMPVEDVASMIGSGPEGDSDRIGDLKQALSTLPHAQREVLVLRHIAGLSPGEIATRTGRTEGAIHGLHHRGRRALAKELVGLQAAPLTAC